MSTCVPPPRQCPTTSTSAPNVETPTAPSFQQQYGYTAPAQDSFKKAPALPNPDWERRTNQDGSVDLKGSQQANERASRWDSLGRIPFLGAAVQASASMFQLFGGAALAPLTGDTSLVKEGAANFVKSFASMYTGGLASWLFMKKNDDDAAAYKAAQQAQQPVAVRK